MITTSKQQQLVRDSNPDLNQTYSFTCNKASDKKDHQDGETRKSGRTADPEFITAPQLASQLGSSSQLNLRAVGH